MYNGWKFTAFETFEFKTSCTLNDLPGGLLQSNATETQKSRKRKSDGKVGGVEVVGGVGGAVVVRDPGWKAYLSGM